MNQKIERLASSIHKSAARTLQEALPGEYVTVTEVEVSPDAGSATVWVSILDDARRDELFARARGETGRIRSRFTRDVRIRQAPGITLELDERARRAQAVEDTLKEL